MPEVLVKVKSPLKQATYSLTADGEDTFNGIKYYLRSLGPLAQPASAMRLAYKGEAVSGLAQLSSLPATNGELELTMVLERQTLLDVSFQLEQACDAFGLAAVENNYVNGGSTRLHEIKKGSAKSKKISESQLLELAELRSTSVDNSPEVKGIHASYPNAALPKPAALELKFSDKQALCNDPRIKAKNILAFIDFVSNDGKLWTFVATSTGFAYVPKQQGDRKSLPLPTATTTFVPTLLQLIEQVSPVTVNTARKNAEKIKANPLSCVSIPQVLSVAPWLVADVPPLDTVLNSSVASSKDDTTREWNEEFQSLRELNVESIAERITRDRSMFQIAADFATAATEGSVKIVEGGMKALNVEEDVEQARVYLSKGIFYTHGSEPTEAGSFESNPAAKKDLRGIQQLMLLNESKLAPVLTTVVDYMGRRIVAQAPVPGIFRETEEPLIIYGQSEGQDEVYYDEHVDGLMEKLAKRLHLKKHPVNRDNVQLQTSVEVHATKSTDGRIYAIDLYRLQVPDVYDSFGTGGMNFIRFEAIAAYYEKHPDAESLNPDAWISPEDLPRSYAPELARDLENLRDVSKFVRETILTDFVAGVANESGIDPIDGVHLTTLMHRAGLNMRLLGSIADAANESKLTSLSAVATEEAIARTMKYLLRKELQRATEFEESLLLTDAFIAKFRKQKDEELTKAIEARLIEHFKFTKLPEGWAEKHFSRLSLLRLLSLKMGLQLDENEKVVAINPVTRYSSPHSSVADEAIEAGRRSLEAAAAAVQAAKSGSGSPEPSHDDTESKVAKTDQQALVDETDKDTNEKKTPTLNSGDASSGSKENDPEDEQADANNELAESLTIISEAVVIFSQIYGSAHAEVARVLHQAAILFLEYGNDVVKAIEYERKAITLAERIEGIDNFDVIVMYTNLAYFERVAGHLSTALELSQRVLEMFSQISWPGYSDAAATYNSVAMMLLQSGKPKLQEAALPWFEKTIDVAKSSSSGPSGNLLFEYAQAQLIKGDIKAASRTMEHSYQTFRRVKGAENESTKEAKKFLEQLLHYMVRNAQTDAAQAKAKARIAASTPTVKSKKQTKPTKSVPRVGEQNLNDVVNYIMGTKSSEPNEKNTKKKSHKK